MATRSDALVLVLVLAYGDSTLNDAGGDNGGDSGGAARGEKTVATAVPSSVCPSGSGSGGDGGTEGEIIDDGIVNLERGGAVGRCQLVSPVIACQ